MTEIVAQRTVKGDLDSAGGTANVPASAVVEGSQRVAGSGEHEDDCEEDEDEDEEEAEEIARRLKEQLWADINKAQAAKLATASSSAPVSARSPQTALSKKQDAAFDTMRGILAITAADSLARSVLASAVVPGTRNDNVLNVLNQVVRVGSISRDLAKSLAPVLVSLARSDALFATMRHSNAPAMQLDKGKRKRDESEEEQRRNDSRAPKRPNVVAHSDFKRQITEAVNVVSNALGAKSPADRTALDPSVISSVQLHLHQLFLFAMTSSAGGGPEMNALQEIGGLIQVLGVLSGIQIGPTAAAQNDAQAPGSAVHPWITQGTTPNPSVPFNDIGTAVYPCLVPGCDKVFARLYSLRAHQRVHAMHRPFRCAVCPASFARNHDLKRHAKLHEKRAWQCAGCDKMFSRRDAIKRHKNSSATRGGKGEVCVGAAIKEVALDGEGEGDAVREGRRTRMWADIVAGGAAATTWQQGTHHGDDGHVEEGEVQGDVIRQMQADVLGLHATLQRHVSAALGTDHAAPPPHVDPTGGQATLASVIARAQMQNLAQARSSSTSSSSSSSLQVVGRAMVVCSGDNSGSDVVVVRPEGSCVSYPGDGHALVLAPPLPASLGLGRAVEDGGRAEAALSGSQLSLYGLSEEQTKLLEQAIANAASAAQAQAEAEAALEEEDEDEEDEDEQQHDADEMNDVSIGSNASQARGSTTAAAPGH